MYQAFFDPRDDGDYDLAMIVTKRFHDEDPDAYHAMLSGAIATGSRVEEFDKLADISDVLCTHDGPCPND